MSKSESTWGSLASELGVTPKSVERWRQKYADAPAAPDVDAWRAYVRRKGLGNSNNRVRPDRDDLMAAKTAADTKLVLIKIAKEERKLVPADQVENFHLFAASRLKSALYQVFATELPPKTANSDTSEVRKANRDACDAICLSMQSTFDEWAKEQKAARAAAASVGDEDEGDDDET